MSTTLSLFFAFKLYIPAPVFISVVKSASKLLELLSKLLQNEPDIVSSSSEFGRKDGSQLSEQSDGDDAS